MAMTTPRQYRKKPVVIEAMHLDGTADSRAAVAGWLSKYGQTTLIDTSDASIPVIIPTLEGDMRADTGDYVIRGVKGEFYPCKPDIFDATYDHVEGT